MGKTSITLRFAKNEFDQNQKSTLNAFFLEQQIRVADGRAGGGDPKVVKLQIWDTAGHERFQSATKNFYRNKDGFIVTFALNDAQSFKNMKNWLQAMDETCPDD